MAAGNGFDDDERAALMAALFGAEDVPTALDGDLLRTRDVALLFGVSERAVTDWARKGRIPSVRTPGGHRRYPARQIRARLTEWVDPGDEPGQAEADGRPGSASKSSGLGRQP